jgi:hypothetical protein
MRIFLVRKMTLIKLEMNGATTIGHKFKKGKEGYMF